MVLPQGMEIIFQSTIAVHLAISVIITIVGYIRKTERTKHLPFLFLANLGIFLTIVFVGVEYLQFEKSLDLISFLGYVIIGGYVVTIEIPGYIILSKYDEKLINTLQESRKKIIDLNYNIDGISGLETYCQSNKKILKSVSLYDIIEAFVKRCKTISNIDKTLYEITVKEIGEQVNTVSTRSKHPFPKLIEIMSLAGISFLLSQFLDHFLS